MKKRADDFIEDLQKIRKQLESDEKKISKSECEITDLQQNASRL
jgi:hypothetical protein